MADSEKPMVCSHCGSNRMYRRRAGTSMEDTYCPMCKGTNCEEKDDSKEEQRAPEAQD